MSIGITGVVGLGAGSLDLLETPLRKVNGSSAEIASQNLVLQAEGSGESADLGAIARVGVLDDLNLPVVLLITHSKVAIARNLLVGLGQGSGDLVGMEVAAGLGVDEANSAAITNVTDLVRLLVIRLLPTVRVEEPVVVGILMVVASDLLLVRAFGVGLNVTVKQATTIAHVLDGDAGAESKLQRAVPANLGAPQVSLEERGHLSIARAGVGQNQEVDGKARKVNHKGHDNEADNASANVGSQNFGGHLDIAKLVPKVLNGVETDKRGNEESHPLDTADEADAETSQEQPKEPFGREAPPAEVMELGPAQSGGNGTEKKHRVEEDETADGGVRVLAENHESDEPDGRELEAKLLGGIVGHGNTHGSPESVELAHEGVVDFRGVGLAGLELERSIVTSKQSAQTNEELSGRRVDIEVELALEVVATELSETVRCIVSASLEICGIWTDGCAHWASSHVTMGERPILKKRVKKARNVNTRGAMIHSWLARESRKLCS